MHAPDLLGTEAAPVGLRRDLRCQQDLVPMAGDRDRDQLLGPAVAVDLGGVDPVDVGVEHGADRLDDPLGRRASPHSLPAPASQAPYPTTEAPGPGIPACASASSPPRGSVRTRYRGRASAHGGGRYAR